MGTHKPRSYSVNDFLSWNERKELVLQPKFQRRDVWSPKAKSHLIDTILRGLPIPIIFIRQNIDPKQRKTIREVVDGQQRLRAVIAFCLDEFCVLKSQNQTHAGKVFSLLSQEIQQSFLNYEFSVVLLEEVSDAEVLDIFARLNSYAQKLTEQELLNAAYFGEFKQTVYSLGREHLEFWRQNHILQDRQIIRMAEADLTSELLVVMLEGVQHRRAKIKDSYDDYDDEFPSRIRFKKEFRVIIDSINNCFNEGLQNTIFCKRVLFYSLFCAFYHTIYGIPKTPELGKDKILRQLNSSVLLSIRNSLGNLSKKYKEPFPSEDIIKFISASQKATGDREQRLIRIKIIYQYIQRALKSRE